MQHQHFALPVSLTAALLTLAARPASAQGSSVYQADAYGAPSGPSVIQSLGLILEFVPEGFGTSTSDCLRLSGGAPGEPAALVVSSAPAASAGRDGTMRLVAGGAMILDGTFDEGGAFTLAVADLPPEWLASGFYAQGLLNGRLAPGPIRREGLAASQGLHVAPAETLGSGALADFSSRLPVARRDTLDAAFAGGDLAGFLSTALDSDGDSVGVVLDADLKVTVYPGISLGGKAAFEAAVTRAGGCYSVSVKREVGALASVGAGDFAGVEGARSLAERQVFVFPSAAGAARGIWGLWLAQQLPPATGMPTLPDLDLAAAAEQAWELARTRLAAASQRVAAARAQLDRVGSGRSLSARIARSIASAGLALADAALQSARQLEGRARVAVEGLRAELQSQLSGVWMAQRLLFELDGARRFAAQHADGGELSFITSGEFKLSLLGSVVSIQGTDLGFAVGAEKLCSVRFGRCVNGAAPIEIKLSRKSEIEGWAGYLIGGRVHYERALVGSLAFELGPGASAGRTMAVAVEADAWARAETTVGIGAANPIHGVSSASGVGRKASLTVDPAEVAAAVAAADGLGAGLEGLLNVSGNLDLADYRIEGYVAQYGIDIAGTGGSVGFEALVQDAGAALDVDDITLQGLHSGILEALQSWIAPGS